MLNTSFYSGMEQESNGIISQQWKGGFLQGLKWIAVGILTAFIVGIVTQDPVFTVVGLFVGVIGAFLWTSYRKYG